jgi:hypothetical protein
LTTLPASTWIVASVGAAANAAAVSTIDQLVMIGLLMSALIVLHRSEQGQARPFSASRLH